MREVLTECLPPRWRREVDRAVLAALLAAPGEPPPVRPAPGVYLPLLAFRGPTRALVDAWVAAVAARAGLSPERLLCRYDARIACFVLRAAPGNAAAADAAADALLDTLEEACRRRDDGLPFQIGPDVAGGAPVVVG